MSQFLSTNRKTLLVALGILLVYFFAFHNLTRYPAPWFDEGSHLHVPKTLAQYGEYADISSDGFRYYGPTIGVGPTVMLPIAAAFKIFGIGAVRDGVVPVGGVLHLFQTGGASLWQGSGMGRPGVDLILAERVIFGIWASTIGGSAGLFLSGSRPLSLVRQME
jgi:hypothetical protein